MLLCSPLRLRRSRVGRYFRCFGSDTLAARRASRIRQRFHLFSWRLASSSRSLPDTAAGSHSVVSRTRGWRLRRSLACLYCVLPSSTRSFPSVRSPGRRVTCGFSHQWRKTCGFLAYLPNLLSTMSPGYVAFQLSYVFVGCVLVGLSRQWTGTIIYATLSHMAVNYIAWSTS